MKLAKFRADVNKPVDTELGLLKKYFFRQKFGSETLDISKT